MLKKISFLIASPFIAVGAYTSYKSYLPKEKKTLHIVFDLDHTLIHSEKKSYVNQLNTKNIKNPDTEFEKYYVWKRPFLTPVLWSLSQFTNLHLMTRATGDYADDICHKLNIDRFFQTKNARENEISNGTCKDISTIDRTIDPDKIILVDDLKYNCCPDQKIYHIAPYYVFSKYDFELLKLYFHVLLLDLKN